MLYLFVFAQILTQNRTTLLLDLLQPGQAADLAIVRPSG